MHIHAEIPLVPFLCLTHLRVPFLLAILGRTWRIDDGGIHDSFVADLYAVFRQTFPNAHKMLLAQLVRFQEMPELADRGLIRNGLVTQINSYESPHGA